MSSKVAGTWKVRPMPARAWMSDVVPVRLTPSKLTVPDVGMVSPARQLKKVDLPAPFGPIRPMISPSATVRSALRTAKKLPNALETPFASSSMARPPPHRDAMPELVETAGLETREQHDDAAIEDVGEAGARAAEPSVGGRLQRHQDQRADQGAEQRAGAAERGGDQHLHRHEQADPTLRIDKAGLDRIERAGDRGESRAQHQRPQLRLPHRHAEARGGALIGTDRAQVRAEAAALHFEGDIEQDHEHAEEDVIVGQLAAEGQVPPAAANRGSLQADRSAEIIDGADIDADQLGDGNGRHAEIMAAQAERRIPDRDRQDHAQRNADGNA